MILILLLYLVFSSMIFFNSSIMLTNPYPVMVGSVRTLASALIVLGGFLCTYSFGQLRTKFRQLCSLRFFTMSFCLYIVAISFFSLAMQYLDPVTGCFIFVTAPFITALILYLYYDVALTVQKFAGMLVGLVSVIAIILLSPHHTVDICIHQKIWSSCIFFLATAAYAYGWVLSKDVVTHTRLQPMFVNACAMLVGGVITMLYTLGTMVTGYVQFSFTSDFWPMMAVFSILTFASYNFYAYLLTIYSATFVSLASFLEPAFALLYAWLFFGQQMSVSAGVCMLGLFAGLYLFHREE